MPYTLALQTSAKELPFSTPAQVIKDASKVRLKRLLILAETYILCPVLGIEPQLRLHLFFPPNSHISFE